MELLWHPADVLWHHPILARGAKFKSSGRAERVINCCSLSPAINHIFNWICLSYFMLMRGLHPCMDVRHVCTEEGGQSPGTVMDSSEWPRVCWEPSLGPLKEQVLWTSETFPAPARLCCNITAKPMEAKWAVFQGPSVVLFYLQVELGCFGVLWGTSPWAAATGVIVHFQYKVMQIPKTRKTAVRATTQNPQSTITSYLNQKVSAP